MKINKLRPIWDNRYNFKRKYNYFMEEFDPIEKLVDFAFFVYRKIYRFLEIRFIVWYERQFDAIQRKQLLISKYLFKFMVVTCFFGYIFLWLYGLHTRPALISPLGSKVEAKEKQEPATTISEPILEISVILDYVHMKESSRGFNEDETALHNYCKSIGKSNEYGFRPSSNRNYCFDSYEQSVLYISDYLKGLVEEFGLYEGLCVYNTGLTRYGNCEYVELLKSWKAN